MKRNFGVAGASVLALAIGASGAQAATKCAKSDEVTAIQAASIQQQLMVAALTCNDVAPFNAFQTGFGPELRKADRVLMKMFTRFYGSRRGQAEYHAFKTRVANDSSMRSIHNAQDYCATANAAFAAALVPSKPALASFVSAVPIMEANPYDSCSISVAVNMRGVIPAIVPKPRPEVTQAAAVVAQPGGPVAHAAVVPAVAH